MIRILLVCLFVLTSSAFGRSAYGGGYGAAPAVPSAPRLLAAIRESTIQRPTLPVVSVSAPTYGQPQPIVTQRLGPIVQQDLSFMQPKLPTAYGASLAHPMTLVRTLPTQGYGAAPLIPQFEQPIAQPIVQPLTPADILCQGQVAETVIPVDNGRKFVVCLDDGKGVEQECPRGLFYHITTRRCERKTGPVDLCASQPCLNGGQCIATEFSYQCQCAPGFDGHTCELDARICQTQQPCGQAPDTRCQSFRLGAALQYICIFQDGLAYGLTPQQVIRSPCEDIDGPQALAITNGGFAMCDSSRMFIESCPGGTIWDDVEKACSWPDKQTFVSFEEPRVFAKSTYGSQYSVPKPTVSYGEEVIFQKPLEFPKATVSYGAPLIVPQPIERPRLISSFKTNTIISKPTTSYGSPLIVETFEKPKLVQTHFSEVNIPKQLEFTKPVETYAVPMPVPQTFEVPRPVSGYGAQTLLPQQPEQFKGIHPQRDEFVPVKTSSGY